MKKSGVSFLDKFTVDVEGNIVEISSQPKNNLSINTNVEIEEKKQENNKNASPVQNKSPKLSQSNKLEKSENLQEKRKSYAGKTTIIDETIFDIPKNRNSLPESDQIKLAVKNSERRKTILKEDEKEKKNIMNVPPRKKSTPYILSEDEQRIKNLIKKYLL